MVTPFFAGSMDTLLAADVLLQRSIVDPRAIVLRTGADVHIHRRKGKPS